MCTRFYIEKENAELEDIIEAAKRSSLTKRFLVELSKPLMTAGEIRPTDVVPVIAPNRSGKRAVFPMKWGFSIPQGWRKEGVRKGDTVDTAKEQSLENTLAGKKATPTGFAEKKSLIVNARTETAPAKATFREAWERHRCVIPASWYYEWEHFISNDGKKKTGSKYTIQPKGEAITWLCGLYRFEEELPVFTVLTRNAEGELSKIHDRMPLILPGNMIDDWISIDKKAEAVLPHTLTEMVSERNDTDSDEGQVLCF